MEPLCLHLRCSSSSSSDGEDLLDEYTTGKAGALKRLESLLWQLLGPEGRSEARMWLCTDIGALQNVSHEVQASIFFSLIKPDGHELDELLCKQTLRVACERQPRGVMRLFFRDSKLIRSFFSGNAKRILDWFEKFSTSQKKDELGAQALARFAFINREQFWSELEWKGTHGQAPATVASKPYYFLDLDVLRTVENFLKYVPEFWSSDELWDSLKDGDILSLDIDFFVGKLFQQMEDGSSHVWKMLKQFFWDDDFTHLCHRLLSFLEDQKLLHFVNELSHNSAHASVRGGSKTGKNDDWLMKVLNMGAVCPSLECVMICNGCIAHSRQLYRLVEDGEYPKESNFLVDLLRQSTNSTQQKHCGLWKESLGWSKWELMKGLALEFWAIQILMWKEYKSSESLRALLHANSIQFRQPSVDKKKKAARSKEKIIKKKKRRRRNAYLGFDVKSNSGESDLDSFDSGLEAKNDCWYLSTNSFSLRMKKDEVPEQLASFAFMQWLNWCMG